MVIVYRNGEKDPPDVSRVAPAAQLLVDTTPPEVRILKANRQGEEVHVEWDIEDLFPNDNATQVAYRSVGSGESGWMSVPAGKVRGRSVRFQPGMSGALEVRVAAKDYAEHNGSRTAEIPAATTSAYLTNTDTKPADKVEPTSGVLPPPMLPEMNDDQKPAEGQANYSREPGPSNLITPNFNPIQPNLMNVPSTGMGGQPQSTPGPAPAQNFSAPQNQQQYQPPATNPQMAGGNQTQFQPTYQGQPEANNQPNWQQANTQQNDTQQERSPTNNEPIAVGTGSQYAEDMASPDVQVVNFLRFNLDYQIENGPSGISRIDLYVTRDDGQTWMKWSQHDGQESPLQVVLDQRFNRQQEGSYGFRLVPVSGAGLADPAPTPGSMPEMKVHVDRTPPMIKVYAPTADPNKRNALQLHWEATDKNFGEDPIAIEWSEQPNGPWKPVSGGDAIAPVAGNGAKANRIANTGIYSWSLPSGLGTHKVYLKFTAWDAAGNRSEVVTPQPVTVDLTKPRAKIQGIVGATVTIERP